MANLIPDVTGSLRINTASAMNDYQAAMRNIRDAVASPGALIDKYLEREDKERREAEEKKRYETELGFKQRQEGSRAREQHWKKASVVTMTMMMAVLWRRRLPLVAPPL